MIDEKKMKLTIAANIAAYRKAKGMTQAELAAALNYSDKSISKWERAEGVPDIYVLTVMAELFGVTLNDLVFEHEKTIEEELAEETLKVESPKGPSIFSYIHNRVLVSILSGGIVWLVAAVIFFFLRVFLPDYDRSWMVFIYAIPITCIVFTVFSGLWHSHLAQFISVSGLIWSSAVSVVLSVPGGSLSSFYIIAIILQVMAVIWYGMRIWNIRLFGAGKADNAESETEDE